MKGGAVSRGLALLIGAALLTLFGCGGESPTTAPTTQDFERERAQVAARAAKAKKAKKPNAGPAQQAAAGEEGAAEENFAALATGYRYEAEGKRDPFRPFRISPKNNESEIGGPLEQFELEQLEVVAVVWSAQKPRAMVSDPSGGTYTIGVDSKMGKNKGRVIHIGDNLVLVKETYVDFAGERTTKDVELRIRGNQGG